jgi:geranylgeranyl pyrophosphate synthase
VTLPVLIYLERESDTRAVDAVLSGETAPERVQAAVEAIEMSGAIEVALAEARSLARQSQRALESAPDNAAREMLHRLADYAVTRRH